FTYGSGVGRPGPFVVNQLSGSYFNTPDFLANQHRVQDAEGADAYLARMQAFAERLDHETDRIRADDAQGVALSSVILDKTISQITTLRDTPAAQSMIVEALDRKSREAGLNGYGERAAALMD